MLAHERFELADHTGVPTERELGLESPFERLEAQLLEPEDLSARESFCCELPERPPAPERQGCTQPIQRVLRRKPVRLVQQTLELLEVECTRLDGQGVAGTARFDRCLAEQLPQLRDVNLKGLRRARRRPVLPEELDQDGRRKQLVRVQKKN